MLQVNIIYIYMRIYIYVYVYLINNFFFIQEKLIEWIKRKFVVIYLDLYIKRVLLLLYSFKKWITENLGNYKLNIQFIWFNKNWKLF